MTEFRKRLLPAWLTAVVLATATAGAQAQGAASPTQDTAPTKSAPAGSVGDSGGGSPKTPPQTEPNTVILSKEAHYDDAKKTSIFTGNVTMTRGLMTLYADELQMREDAQGNRFGTALAAPGKMVTVRQERPENFEVIEGVGRRAEYDGRNETFDLIGQAVVTRFICGKPFDNIHGDKVRYNQNSNTYNAIGGPDSSAPSGRVRSVMEPRARADAAIAECQRQQAGKKPASKNTAPKGSTSSSPNKAGQPADRGNNDGNSGKPSSGGPAVKN